MGTGRAAASPQRVSELTRSGSRPARRLQRALFIRTDRLGETLLNVPAIAALKQGVPDATVSVLVQPELAPLIRSFRWIDDVLECPSVAGQPWWRQAVRLARVLRPRRFDAAIVSNPSKMLHVAVWLAGIPTRLGYDRKWGRLLTHRVADRKALGGRHEVEYNLELVQALGLPSAIPTYEGPRLEGERASVLQLLQAHGVDPSLGLLACHPWTSDPRKQWPPERYAAVIRLSVQRWGIPVVIIGGAEHAAQAQALMPSGERITNLVGRVNLPELAALLGQARLLVSNDSGPVHLAAAVGTRTIVLFGSCAPAPGPVRWRPWGQGHTVIAKPSVQAISVEDVMGAIQAVLA